MKKSVVGLLAGLTCVWLLTMSGCGGGGGGGGGSTPTAVVTQTVSVTPYKGMFTSGVVAVTDANGKAVALLNGSGTITSTGLSSIVVADTTVYPLVVSVTGTYISELTGLPVTTSTTLRSIVPDAQTAAAGVPVTALTEIAANIVLSSGLPLTANLATNTLTIVANSLLGQTYQQAMTLPSFNTQGQALNSATMQLAALALAANSAPTGGGSDLAANIKALGNALASGGVVSTVLPQSVLNAAVASVNGGSLSILPTGWTPLTPPSSALSGATLVSPATPPAGTIFVWDQSTTTFDTAVWR